jgi:hypothetical protein
VKLLASKNLVSEGFDLRVFDRIALGTQRKAQFHRRADACLFRMRDRTAD